MAKRLPASEKWREKIRAALARIGELLGLPGVPEVLVNADDSVDGEIRFKVPRGKARRYLIKLSKAVRAPVGTWITVGSLFAQGQIHDKASRDTYRLIGGKAAIAPNLRRARYKQQQIATAIAWHDAMRSNWDGAEASEIIVRITRARKRLPMIGEK